MLSHIFCDCYDHKLKRDERQRERTGGKEDEESKGGNKGKGLVWVKRRMEKFVKMFRKIKYLETYTTRNGFKHFFKHFFFVSAKNGFLTQFLDFVEIYEKENGDARNSKKC